MPRELYINRWVELFQGEVERLVGDKLTEAKTDNLNTAINEIVSKHERSDMGVLQMQRVLQKYDLPEKLYSLAANAAILASAVEIYFVNREKLTEEQMELVRPAAQLISRSPKDTASKIVEASEKAEEPERPSWVDDTLMILTADYAGQLKKQYTSRFKKEQKRADRTVARQIRKDTKNTKKQLKDARQKEVAERLKKKWVTPTTVVRDGKKQEDVLTRSYAKRNIESQVHNQTEAVKATDAYVKGFKYKQWITKLDERVRSSHKSIHGQTIRIDKLFNVGASEASYPGDPRLPIGEKINCRCKLKYKNTIF